MRRIAGTGALVLLLVIVFAYNNLWRRPLACQLAASGDTVQLARLASAQLRQTDPLGNSALMFAAAADQKPAIALLLARGANPHAVNHNGATALMLAAAAGASDIIPLLPTSRPAIDMRNSDGVSALMSAAWNGQSDSVALLLSLGANPCLRDRQGNTAEDDAIARGQHLSQKILRDFSRQNGIVCQGEDHE